MEFLLFSFNVLKYGILGDRTDAFVNAHWFSKKLNAKKKQQENPQWGITLNWWRVPAFRAMPDNIFGMYVFILHSFAHDRVRIPKLTMLT